MNTIDRIRVVAQEALNDCSVVNEDRRRWQEVRKLLDRLELTNEVTINITGLVNESVFEQRVLQIVARALEK